MDKIILFILLIADIFPGQSSLAKTLESRLTNFDLTTVKEEGERPPLSIFAPLPARSLSYNELSSEAKAVLVYDSDTATLLGSKNANQKYQIASLTKLMTAYVCLSHQKDLTQVVQVGSLEKARSSDARLGLVPGEKISYLHLIEGILINSGSDAAITIAENVTGGYDSFIEEMNRQAEKMKLENTRFDNPVGWDSPDNYSTAADLLALSRVIAQNNDLREIAATRSKVIVSASGIEHQLTNTNILLDNLTYFGLKTGFYDAAGGCLISLVKIKNKNFIIVLLGSADRFEETKRVVEWTEKSYNW